ncbi:hypothetical protein NUW54_g7729 [Trametes sanguinea]|uniref:Uncharacterized protein n=1 Tax=Trametes sanguinea TaxID=158606 RepID=A0ACC1PJP7_9APHY|nr:hypothetical protein NUW54_g7729 [Trametes sanguinea]
MSASAALAKLPSPLKDLVAGAVQDGSEDFGKSEKDKAEVAEWIDKVAQGDVAKPEKFQMWLFTARCTHHCPNSSQRNTTRIPPSHATSITSSTVPPSAKLPSPSPPRSP